MSLSPLSPLSPARMPHPKMKLKTPAEEEEDFDSGQYRSLKFIRSQVQNIEGLRKMTKLVLVGNQATKVPPIKTLRLHFCQLIHFDLSNNMIKNLYGIDLCKSLPFLQVFKVCSNRLYQLSDILAFREHKHLKEFDFKENPHLPFIDKRLIILHRLIMDELTSDRQNQNSVGYLQATYQQIVKPIQSELVISPFDVEHDKKYQQDRQKDHQIAQTPRHYGYFKQLAHLNGQQINLYELKTIGYMEYEELMESKNALLSSSKKNKNKMRGNDKKPLTQYELHKLLREAKEKHDIEQEQLEILKHIQYQIKPEKIKVDEITISPRKLKKYEEQREGKIRENLLKHIRGKHYFEEEKSDLCEEDNVKDEMNVDEEGGDSSDDSEEEDGNKYGKKQKAVLKTKINDLNSSKEQEQQNELESIRKRKSNLVKKIKLKLNDLMMIQRQNSKESTTKDSEEDDHNDNQEIFQLAHQRVSQLEFKPIELELVQQPSIRFQISQANILFDFYPTFNEMNTQMQLKKLEEFFNKSEDELLDALNDKETFQKIETDMIEVQRELSQSMTSLRKGFSFDDVRRFLKEYNSKHKSKDKMLTPAEELVGVVNMYRDGRAKELNLPKIQIKEHDIENILKSGEILPTERFNRLTGILELTDQYKHFKEIEKQKHGGEQGLMKFIKNKEAEEKHQRIVKTHRDRIQAVQSIKLGPQRKMNEADIDQKRYALSIKGTVNFTNNYNLSPTKKTVQSTKNNRSPTKHLNLIKAVSTADLNLVNLRNQAQKAQEDKMRSSYSNTMIRKSQRVMRKSHHDFRGNEQIIQTHRPAIMKGSVHEIFPNINEQLNQPKQAFNLVKKFEKDIRLLPDFKEYDQEIEQNKQSIKQANKFYAYQLNEEQNEGEDGFLPAQYKRELEQKRIQEKKHKKIIIGSKYKINNHPLIKYEELTEIQRRNYPQYFKVSIEDQPEKINDQILSLRQRRQSSMDNQFSKELEIQTLKALVRQIIVKDLKENPQQL
ncbi:UNKNOWN [Stylonychia lemnae]|uniref:Leucine rich repeat family protein n=1 Tax=Stylonychia lemnae TaxID=5949 RepID=A0A077ZQN9_STYLE|nr:UNKNOWN [Stylonychia lemnae]|eukprot:CDW71700.1 UNKNOWN [Stylonychia lemnae]